MDNWSDFLATPPNFGSCSPSFPMNDLLGDSSLQQPSNYIIPSNQYSNIFPNQNQMQSSQQPQINSVINSPPVDASHSPDSASPPQQQTSNSNFPSYQEPYNEIENRSLLASGLNPQTTFEEIKQKFDPNNSTKNIELSNLPNGQIIIEYYDLRDAQTYKRFLNGTTLHGAVINVAYAPLQKIDDPRKPPNNGTIVVFHLPNGMTDHHIESTFGHFGEIRQIRGTPAKPTQRFIEFWDTRSAENALTNLSGRYVMGSRVSIEFSLPGGFRRNVQRVDQSGMQKY